MIMIMMMMMMIISHCNSGDYNDENHVMVF